MASTYRGHIFAVDPRVPAKRRAVSIDRRRRYADVDLLVYTSLDRCMWRPNPKRPTWRCKSKPTQLIQMKSLGMPSVPSFAVCDEHLTDALRSEWRSN